MIKYFYSPEMIQYVRDNCNTKSNMLLAEEMSRIFNEFVDNKSVHNIMKRFDIKREGVDGHQLRNAEMLKKTVPAEIDDFIRQNHVGINQKKMVELVKQKFGVEYSHSYMKYYYRKMGYCSGLTGRFSADDPRVAKNRFKKGVHASAATEFGKGHRPYNAVPVGTIVKQTEGFWAKKIAEPNVWKQMHKIIWEEANGPVPEGKCLIFLDGNHDHYQLDNLMLVSRAENAQVRKYRSECADCTRLGVMNVRLQNKVKEVQHG